MTDLKRRVNVQQDATVGRRTENETLQKKLKDRSDELLAIVDEVNVSSSITRHGDAKDRTTRVDCRTLRRRMSRCALRWSS